MSFFDDLREHGLTAFGKVMLATHPPLTRAIHCREVIEKAQNGDILLRKYSCYLDGHCIPGEFSHSGIVERAETDRTYGSVIHAVAEGVSRIDILDFVKDTDGFALLRPLGEASMPYDPDAAIQYARMAVGKPYDFGFSVEADLKNVSAFFCHKLTALAIADGGVKLLPMMKAVGPVVHEVYLAEQFLGDPRIKLIYRTEF